MIGGGLAGCLSTSPQSPKTAATGGSPASGEVAANATNGTAPVDTGTGTMNVSTGDQAHFHDYWVGRERVTVMDADVNVDPQTAFQYTFYDTARGTPGVGGAQFTLPEGQLVFEGTGKMEITATWTDPTVTGVGIAYKSAATTTYTPAKDVKTGVPMTIDVTPEMTDMPHSKTTRWAFFLEPDQAGQVIEGTIHVKIDIIKMRDVALWPGHPHLFDGADTLELWKGSGSSSQQNFVLSAADFITKTPVQDESLQSKQVVPMETLNMTANLTIKTTNVDIGKVTNITFGVKPANSNRFYPAHLVKFDASTNTYYYAWQVTMEQTDSPYAKESAWRFDVQVDTDPSGGTLHGQCGGCSNARVDYDLVVIAYDGAVDGSMPLTYSYRGGG
jgi:hypothetical protein